MAVSGLAMGIIDTIANIQLVSIYKKDSAMFLQVRRDIYLQISHSGVVLVHTFSSLKCLFQQVLYEFWYEYRFNV